MKFNILKKTYGEDLVDNPIGLYLAFTGFVIIGLFFDPDLVGLIIFNRLIGWQSFFTEEDFIK